MKINRKKSTLALGGVIAFAVLAGFGVMEAIVKISNTQTVVVSTHYLAPFTKIDPKDVRTVSIPAGTGITGLAANANDVVGHYLTFPIPAGYPVTASDLSSADSYSSFLTQWELKNNQQGVMLELKLNNDVLQLVQPNENIDLLVPDKVNQGAIKQVVVSVLSKLTPATGGNAAGLMVFVPSSEFADVAPAILSGSVQVGLISQQGSYSTQSAITAYPATLGQGPVQNQSSSTAPSVGTQTTGQQVQSGPSVNVTTTPSGQQPVTPPPGTVTSTGNGGH